MKRENRIRDRLFMAFLMDSDRLSNPSKENKVVVIGWKGLCAKAWWLNTNTYHAPNGLNAGLNTFN